MPLANWLKKPVVSLSDKTYSDYPEKARSAVSKGRAISPRILEPS
jgi:hypothetical protein